MRIDEGYVKSLNMLDLLDASDNVQQELQRRAAKYLVATTGAPMSVYVHSVDFTMSPRVPGLRGPRTPQVDIIYGLGGGTRIVVAISTFEAVINAQPVGR